MLIDIFFLIKQNLNKLFLNNYYLFDIKIKINNSSKYFNNIYFIS